MQVIKYKYAKSNEKIISINSINESNRKGVFYCLGCYQLLRPRIGNQRAHHFYHVSNVSTTNCSLETYLHRAAKNILFNILSKNHQDREPYYIQLKKKVEFYNFKNQYISFHLLKETIKKNLLDNCTNISVETPIEEFKPDILLKYSDGKNIFIEILVTHESTVKKKNQKKVIEVYVKKEEDLERIKYLLDEETDSFYNLDEYRIITKKTLNRDQRLSSNNVILNNLITFDYKKKVINEIIEDFKLEKLYAEMPFCGLLIPEIKSTSYKLRLLLNEFYNEYKVFFEDEPYCVLSNTKNKKLFIGFTDIIKKASNCDRIYKLEEKILIKPYLLGNNISFTNNLFDFNLVNDNNYKISINCFKPKGYYKSQIIDYKISDLKKSIEDDELEIIRIENVRKI